MGLEFSAYHLADNPKQFQPVRTNNFRCIVQGLDRLLRADGNAANENDYIKNAQEVIDFSVVSFDAPHFTQQPLEVKRWNSSVFYANTPKFNNNQKLVINDFVGADGKSVLEAWQALSYDVYTDKIPSSDKYKIDMIVLEYLPDQTLVKYWELKGCWVAGINESAYNAEQANKKQVTATICYDRALPHRPEELR